MSYARKCTKETAVLSNGEEVTLLLPHSGSSQERIAKRQLGVIILLPSSFEDNEIAPIDILLEMDFILMLLPNFSTDRSDEWALDKSFSMEERFTLASTHMRIDHNIRRLGAVSFDVEASFLIEIATKHTDIVDALVFFNLTEMTPYVKKVHGLLVPSFFIFTNSFSDEDSLVSFLKKNLQYCKVKTQLFTSGNESSFKHLDYDNDAVRELKIWFDAHIHRNSGNWEINRISSSTFQEHDWWVVDSQASCSGSHRIQCSNDMPKFYNIGLAHWEKARNLWRKQYYPRPTPPPVPPFREIEEVGSMIRTFELPGSISLVDMVKVLNELWEADDDS